MGDFHMSLFRVIPEFRSRGVAIDLAAWYLGKDPAGIPCADSCGIFCLNKLGQHYPKIGRYQLDAVVKEGLSRNHDEIRVHTVNCGPSKELNKVLPPQGYGFNAEHVRDFHTI